MTSIWCNNRSCRYNGDGYVCNADFITINTMGECWADKEDEEEEGIDANVTLTEKGLNMAILIKKFECKACGAPWNPDINPNREKCHECGNKMKGDIGEKG